MSSCSSGETLPTPRRGKCLRQRETSHSAEKRVRIFLTMETFKSVHTLVCRGPKQEFMAPCRGAGENFGFRDKFLSGERRSRFALDTIVPVSWPTGLQRRILLDDLS